MTTMNKIMTSMEGESNYFCCSALKMNVLCCQYYLGCFLNCPNARGYEEEAVQGEEALPAGAPPAGPQLMGLLCPKCRTMCQGVQALKEHMQVC